jgi:hypothetical protein
MQDIHVDTIPSLASTNRVSICSLLVLTYVGSLGIQLQYSLENNCYESKIGIKYNMGLLSRLCLNFVFYDRYEIGRKTVIGAHVRVDVYFLLDLITRCS